MKRVYFIKEHLEVAMGYTEGMHTHIGVFTLSTGENVTVAYTEPPSSHLLADVEDLCLTEKVDSLALPSLSYCKGELLADTIVRAIQYYKKFVLNKGEDWVNPPSFLIGYCLSEGVNLYDYPAIWL